MLMMLLLECGPPRVWPEPKTHTASLENLREGDRDSDGGHPRHMLPPERMRLPDSAVSYKDNQRCIIRSASLFGP